MSVVLTPEGRRLLKETSKRLALSSSNVVEALLRQHGPHLTVHSASSICFLQGQTPARVRARLAGFASEYREDWNRWLDTRATNPINGDAAIKEFKRILGNWQAVRPLRLARLGQPISGTRTLQSVLDEAALIVGTLREFTVRDMHSLPPDARGALVHLWRLFASSLCDNGEATCVGITKAVMLVTDGRIGPAFDSRVRHALGIAAPKDSGEWIVALEQVAADLRAFESRHHVRLDDLDVQSPIPVAVGRAYDMAAGPREAVKDE